MPISLDGPSTAHARKAYPEPKGILKRIGLGSRNLVGGGTGWPRRVRIAGQLHEQRKRHSLGFKAKGFDEAQVAEGLI